MTSSADRGSDAVWLGDFLALTLAGDTPRADAGECASRAVRWRWLGDGLLQLEPADAALRMQSVLVSAGVHGDETAPIELLSMLVRDLARGALPLRCRLLVALGNPGAMRAGERYLDDDLNRLFSGLHAQRATSREAPRAAELEAAAARFFATAGRARGARWHIDMHTAIRASVFEQFALLPYTGEPPTRTMFEWLGAARIAAVLLHTVKGSTFSHFTAESCGALACTLELGKVMPFGENDLARFAGADAAVRGLVSGRRDASRGPLPRVFTVVDQITKQSDALELFVAKDVPNFTPFAQGTLLARDGDYRYAVRHAEERIVFPNPSVKPGLRAGLLVVETTDDTHAALA
ncbi:succinylglutamate desuccinylase [Burkholderia oklahomensis]|uniref:succinylglutamate desuccinylase n=1 Tax=Burkholderia oklahomensis TaxID=342113 RepID=UPI00016A90BF|nr:succinylglutamate desuccinylase [Burkholderia oklahomensis]AJX33110.1 succinylglutamate desuccinylase [Burkholderia oklahomensis C6786]AOI45395.1 succinylglutamate desuccinylase [Burkholderia oklahomensis C6786]KUY58786.1 succinylglutamate desuccinylase [Burkholderia oklahomensis C6786]MBI0358527.1 succinylglutamate desuccinylase [Burkholderia oklahomensis]SUW56731.1 Succinylglutamate desuccinylase [Burkholderia oklahomensis]